MMSKSFSLYYIKMESFRSQNLGHISDYKLEKLRKRDCGTKKRNFWRPGSSTIQVVAYRAYAWHVGALSLISGTTCFSLIGVSISTHNSGTPEHHRPVY